MELNSLAWQNQGPVADEVERFEITCKIMRFRPMMYSKPVRMEVVGESTAMQRSLGDRIS